VNTWLAGTTPPAAVPSGRPSGGGLNLTRLALLLEDAHERLAGVVIENLDWPDFMARYDRPETLFYLDPPYWGSEGDYGREQLFSRDQFATLAAALKELQGAFILSINDVPEIPKLFAWAKFEEVELLYTIAGGKGRPARELIISGSAP
jgi:DNA adenine methylase